MVQLRQAIHPQPSIARAVTIGTVCRPEVPNKTYEDVNQNNLEAERNFCQCWPNPPVLVFLICPGDRQICLCDWQSYSRLDK